MRALKSRTTRRAIRLLAALALTMPQTARAQEPDATSPHDDYCTKVMARAQSDATLLYAPSVRVEGVKLPSVVSDAGQLDATGVGANYQARAGISISVTNMFKAPRVERAGEADCVAHKSSVKGQELLMRAPDLGRLGALRDESAFLESQRIVWEAIESKMVERVESKNGTLIDLEDIRTRTTMLARQRSQVRGEIQRLEATGFDAQGIALSALIRNIETSQMNFERELVRVRAVDPWDINITGGYIPPFVAGTQSDFYGVIQFSYNIGGPWHSSHDDTYLSARERELRNARYELPHQLTVLREHIRIAIAQARAELAVVDKRMAVLAQDRSTLAQSESSMAPHALAMLDLEMITNGADQVFLRGLTRELSQMEEKQ